MMARPEAERCQEGVILGPVLIDARTGSAMALSAIQVLGRPCDRHAGHARCGDEIYRCLQPGAGLSVDERLGLCTGRAARPCGVRLESRLTASAVLAEIDFVRRRAFEGHVRPVGCCTTR